jgi:hypothetical protein
VQTAFGSISFPQKEVANVPEPKDVVTAILASAVGLAGLLLVFSGFVLSQAAGFPNTTPNAITKKFEKAARIGMVPFLFALVVSGLSFLWLLHPSPGIYCATVIGFAVLLLGTGLYGAIAFWKYL